MATLVAPAPVGASADRTPAGTRSPSVYEDPCEHSPPGTTPSGADLRQLVVSDLFASDRKTTDESEPVRFTARLCHPLDSSTAPVVRVDLHARRDTEGGPDTDYSEDPSRWLELIPPAAEPDPWTWELRQVTDDPEGQLVAGGEVTVVGRSDAVTELHADVPAAEVRAAGDPSTTSDTGLPPVALRACTNTDDCGPGYAAGSQGTVPTGDPVRADADYLPQPAHLPLTYPSICQHGPVARAGASADPRGPARERPGQAIVDADTAARLSARGWTRVSTLPDGSAVFAGTPGAVSRAVPGAEVASVGLRRPTVEPDDPYYADDGPAAPTGQWSLRRLGAPQAWDVTTGSVDRLVAVLDSGFDGLHPDLAGRAVAGRDFVSTRTSTSRPLDVTTDTDYGGHGSFVASLVAASTDDGTGMASLGWDTGLLIARVFDAEACASDAALVAAMDWAVSQGASAINLSLGGPGESEVLEAAGERAVAAGVLPVAAAGNSSGALVEYPAFYDSFVSVAATGYIVPGSSAEDPIASYSTYNAGVDIAAPGGSGTDDAKDLLGACWRGPTQGRGFCRLAGTSFSTPLVAATIALLDGLDPERTMVGTRQLLADTALDLVACAHCDPGRDDASGAGRLRTGLAATLLARRSETLQVIAPDAGPVAAAVAVSQAAFARSGAAYAVLSRDDVFADTLAGAPLASVHGPILLTPSHRLAAAVEDELRRVLPSGADVFLLGGDAALSPAVEEAVRRAGYVPHRIAGASRIDTAIALSRRVAPRGSSRVLVASAANWPDAVAGGVYAAEAQLPLLLTWPQEAPDALLAELARLAPSQVVLLGGSAAISGAAAERIDAAGGWSVSRVQGPHRWATATAVATQLWGRTTGSVGDQYVLVNGQLEDGWAYGLAASPLATRRDAPLLLTTDDLTLDQPTGLLRDHLRYRVDRPAFGALVGPPVAVDRTLAAFTTQRLRELLGG